VFGDSGGRPLERGVIVFCSADPHIPFRFDAGAVRRAPFKAIPAEPLDANLELMGSELVGEANVAPPNPVAGPFAET
jgi:hypothetical protein